MKKSVPSPMRPNTTKDALQLRRIISDSSHKRLLNLSFEKLSKATSFLMSFFITLLFAKEVMSL
jgi:hypothetical protein